MYKGGVTPSVFYSKTRDRKCSTNDIRSVTLPRRLTGIFGPSCTWKIFRKQNEALAFAKDYNEGLMTFAFQRSDGSRGFLVAHPVVFWCYDTQKKNASDRRTYEVIAENEPCKLYFDLEFDRLCNPGNDGIRMTNSFIYVVCAILKREFNLECNRSSVLDLDSTTDVKFSRHLIFQLEKACFRNNYHVGSFVRMVCHEVRVGCLSGKGIHGVDLSAESLQELFVRDSKGNRNLFCDEGVYTKNRHFRLYRSTKWKKNAPLVISEENEYQIKTSKIEESNNIIEEQFFLHSLVSFIFPSQTMILEISDLICNSYQSQRENGKMVLPSNPVQSDMSLGNSPIPVIDSFIQELVYPGRVRRWVYFIDSNTLDYDIVGNRYCHNIQRAHKSNNVKYVIDLNRGVYYQKCYDPDCSNYRSPETELPMKVKFMMDSESDSELGPVEELSDNDLTEVWESVSALLEEESMANFCSTSSETANRLFDESFPDFGLSDNDLLNLSLAID